MSAHGPLMIAAAVGLVFVCARKRRQRPGGFFLLTAMGVATVIVGMYAFGSRSNDERYDRVGVTIDHVPAIAERFGIDIEPPTIEPPEVQVGDFNTRVERDFSFDRGRHTDTAPKWMLISLGTLLVIVGSLLAGRERTRPVVMKAITILGIAAIGYSLVSFFGSPPRTIANRDRVVRIDGHETARAVRETVAKAVEKAFEKTSRHPRARRPSSRPERPTHDEPTVEALPPRAGTIPVAAELAKTESKSSEAKPIESKPTETPPPQKPATGSPEAPVEQPAAPEKHAAAPVAPAVAAATDKPVETPQPPVVAPAAEAPAAPATAPEASDKPASAPPQPAETPPSTPAEVSQGRPAWVDAPGKLNNTVYSISVSSGPFVSVPECQRELDRQMKQEVDHYIDEYLGENASELVQIPLSYVKQRVKKAEFGEVVVSESVGPMHQIHALLEIDEQARADFHRHWHNAMVTDRLWYAGSGGALVLALLATFYGYLKLDLRTGGAQKGRLQLAATLVALIVAAGALLARWAVPF